MSCLKKFFLWFFTGLVICIIGISDVFAETTPITPSSQNERFMVVYSPSSASSDQTVWSASNVGEPKNLYNSNFDVTPLVFYYTMTFNAEKGVTYTTSFTLSFQYYYNISSASNYSFNKNKNNYAYAVYGAGNVNSYSCSIDKDNITKYDNYTIEDVNISCTYTIKNSKSDQYLSIGVDGQPHYSKYGISGFNGKVTNSMFVTVSAVKNIKNTDNSGVIIDQNNKIIDQNQQIINEQQEQTKTSKSILGKIGDILSYINPFSENFFAYKLVELIINGLKSLFIPKNLDFLENFKDTMSEKLGFIASIPLQLIDFIIDLKDYAFSTPTSLTFPTISIFGYSFWNQMTIDITEGLSWVSAIKYVTDIICVILCVNTLRKFYNSFFGGGEN